MNKRLMLVGAALAWCSATSQATNTQPELEQVMTDLLQWLPGEYSSRPQRYLEGEQGASEEGQHDDWYRIFAPVEVPHIGANVIYGQMHIGNKDALIVPGTQVLYIVAMDPEHRAVSVSGRRIANGEDYAFAHLDPEKLKTIALDPDTGGNCDFRWRRHGNQLVGRLAEPDEAATDGTCTMTSKVSGVTMTWDAEWVLDAEQLWIFDNGYIEGELFIGREDLTHTRLYKTRFFDCKVSLEDRGQSRAFELLMHDRGDEQALGETGLTLRLLRAPMAGSDGFMEHTLLSVRRDADELFSQTLLPGDPSVIDLELGNLTARCAR